jgi:hypothetical protein
MLMAMMWATGMMGKLKEVMLEQLKGRIGDDIEGDDVGLETDGEVVGLETNGEVVGVETVGEVVGVETVGEVVTSSPPLPTRVEVIAHSNPLSWLTKSNGSLVKFKVTFAEIGCQKDVTTSPLPKPDYLNCFFPFVHCIVC